MRKCTNTLHEKEAEKLAILHTTKALDIFRQINSYKAVYNARNLGELYRRAKQYPKALQALNSAIYGQKAEQSDHVLLAELHINRGETYADMGQYERALSDFDSTLYYLSPSYQPGKNSPLPSLSEPIADQTDYLLVLGDIALAQAGLYEKRPERAEALTRAVTVYDTLFRLADRMRAEYLDSDAKIDFIGSLQSNLQKALNVCLRLKNISGEQQYIERAFRIAEQSKAVALLETLRSKHRNRALPEALQQEERRLAEEQAEIEQQMFLRRADAAEMKTLQEKWRENFEFKRKWREKTRKLPGFDPTEPVGADLSLSALQRELLAPDQALVEYFYQDTVLHIFLASAQGLEHAARRLPADFENLVRQLQWETAEGANDPAIEQALCERAHRLYQYLFEPIAAKLPRRLIVIPDAPLHLLPFESLLPEAPVGGIREQVAKQNFLIFRHDFSYCYSANLLREMQGNRVAASLSRQVAVFAPAFKPGLSAADPYLPEPIAQALRFLVPLPNQREMEAISEKVCVQPYAAAAATRARFLDAAGQYAAIHVATHGILNDAAPDFSFISFAQDSATLNQQELLFLRNLEEENMAAELVVFSACETAKGKVMRGEGAKSMARGLAAAGVKSFVTTLWPIHTDNHTRMMPDFYAAFAEGQGLEKDRALANAKRAFINASPVFENPVNWAGVILIGDAGKMTLQLQCSQGNGDNTVWYWLAGALGMAVLAWAFYRRRR